MWAILLTHLLGVRVFDSNEPGVQTKNGRDYCNGCTEPVAEHLEVRATRAEYSTSHHQYVDGNDTQDRDQHHKKRNFTRSQDIFNGRDFHFISLCVK